MFKNMKLKKKILIMLLLPMVVMLSALGVYSYYNASKSLNHQIQQTLTWMADDNSTRILAKLQHRESAVHNLAQLLGSNYISKEQLPAVLKTMKDSNKGVLNVFVGFEDTSYLESNGAVPKEGYDPRIRGWYKKAAATEGQAYSEVYIDEGTKLATVSIAQKIVRDGELIGVIGIDLAMEDYQNIAKEAKVGKTGYAFILDENGNFLFHPTLTLADNIMKINNSAFAEGGKVFLSGKTASTTIKDNGVTKDYVSVPIGKSGWVYVVCVPADELFESVNTLGEVSLATSIIGLLLLAWIIVRVTNHIVQPIQKLSAVVNNLAHGDLRVETGNMVDTAEGDEIGDLTKSLHEMKIQFNNLVKQVSTSSEHVASSSEQLTASAEQAAQVSTQVAQSIIEIANGSNDQMQALTKVVHAVDQRAASIEQIADKAESMAETSKQAADKAQSGAEAVAKAVQQMNTIENTVIQSAEVVSLLGERSKEIGQIVETISGIAGQTNLLALNAAIEAARAGEQGRGFAVVAEEVRKLAEQSALAAKQIETLIVTIQNDTAQAVATMESGTREVKTGSNVVRDSGQIFDEILTMVHNASEQVQDITASVEELAAGGHEIVDVMNELEYIGKETSLQTQSVSAATEESSATAEEIASFSQILAKMAQDLQQEIGKFKL